MHIDIGDEHFKTQGALTKRVQDIISKIGLCSSVKTKSISDYNFFIELFREHPDYPHKTYNISDISIVKNKKGQGFGLYIIKNDGTTDDISWKDCISGHKKNLFKVALRVSVEEQTDSFRKTSSNICALCKISVGPFHVDHENHFEEVVYGFLQTTKRVQPTEFKNTDDNRKSFIAADKEYEDEWKEYHMKEARLRILCAPCNLKRPKWKPASV